MEMAENPEEQVADEEADLDYGSNWHFLLRYIVHRGRPVREAVIDEYDPRAWTESAKPPPFPFNLGEVSYCGVCVALILAAHLEVDTGLVRRYWDFAWTGRVLFKVFVTFVISAVSTLSFEVVGNYLTIMRDDYFDIAEYRIQRWFVEYLRWGNVDEDGHAILQDGGDFVWITDAYHLREPIREFAPSILILALDMLGLLMLVPVKELCRLILTWVIAPICGLGYFPSITNFIANIPAIFALPISGVDEGQSASLVFWEYGIPLLVQVWLSAALWLLAFLCLAKSEWMAMYGYGRCDPKYCLYFHLLRATAMYLLAYTAYQVVRALPSGPHFISPARYPSGITIDVQAAIRLFVTHFFVKVGCELSLQLLFPLFAPFIVWGSNKTEAGVWGSWPIWLSYLQRDMSVLDVNNRVLSRIIMTFLFGLRSSWPTRMNLSATIPDVAHVEETILGWFFMFREEAEEVVV